MAGIDGVPVTVEVDVAGGLPCLEIVGLADTSVREARHRVAQHCTIPVRGCRQEDHG
jgi:predicted ATPase with chaperone activity